MSNICEMEDSLLCELGKMQESSNSPPAPQPPVMLPRPIKSQPAQVKTTQVHDKLISGFLTGGEFRLCFSQFYALFVGDIELHEIMDAYNDLRLYNNLATPEQLQALKIAGVVPPNTDNCGLIQRSLAERLLLYLKPISGLLVPEHLRSDPERIPVVHSCFGGCEGTIYPSLYPSCIECAQCYQLHTPEQFVAHTHVPADSNILGHWGFSSNNWRKYIHLPECLLSKSRAVAMLEAFKTSPWSRKRIANMPSELDMAKRFALQNPLVPMASIAASATALPKPQPQHPQHLQMPQMSHLQQPPLSIAVPVVQHPQAHHPTVVVPVPQKAQPPPQAQPPMFSPKPVNGALQQQQHQFNLIHRFYQMNNTHPQHLPPPNMIGAKPPMAAPSLPTVTMPEKPVVSFNGIPVVPEPRKPSIAPLASLKLPVAPTQATTGSISTIVTGSKLGTAQMMRPNFTHSRSPFADASLENILMLNVPAHVLPVIRAKILANEQGLHSQVKHLSSENEALRRQLNAVMQMVVQNGVVPKISPIPTPQKASPPMHAPIGFNGVRPYLLS